MNEPTPTTDTHSLRTSVWVFLLLAFAVAVAGGLSAAERYGDPALALTIVLTAVSIYVTFGLWLARRNTRSNSWKPAVMRGASLAACAVFAWAIYGDAAGRAGDHQAIGAFLLAIATTVLFDWLPRGDDEGPHQCAVCSSSTQPIARQ